MAKPEWGTKRECTECGERFYDLNNDPLTCPKCGASYSVNIQEPEPVEEEIVEDQTEEDEDDLETEDDLNIDDDDTLLADDEDDEDDVSDIVSTGESSTAISDEDVEDV